MQCLFLWSSAEGQRKPSISLMIIKRYMMKCETIRAEEETFTDDVPGFRKGEESESTDALWDDFQKAQA